MQLLIVVQLMGCYMKCTVSHYTCIIHNNVSIKGTEHIYKFW